MAHYVNIKPELLRWAIKRSGLAIGDYKEGVEKWLSGEKKPTHDQLEKFARRAMVPFGYLFLEQPPNEDLPVPDYRTRTDEGVREPSPNLIETIFEMQTRQDWLGEYLAEEGHAELPFVGSAKIGANIRPLAQRMHEELGLTESWAERC